MVPCSSQCSSVSDVGMFIAMLAGLVLASLESDIHTSSYKTTSSDAHPPDPKAVANKGNTKCVTVCSVI